MTRRVSGTQQSSGLKRRKPRSILHLTIGPTEQSHHLGRKVIRSYGLTQSIEVPFDHRWPQAPPNIGRMYGEGIPESIQYLSDAEQTQYGRS